MREPCHVRSVSILETGPALRGDGEGSGCSGTPPFPPRPPPAPVSVTHRPGRGSHGRSAALDPFPCRQVGAFFRERPGMRGGRRAVPRGGLAGRRGPGGLGVFMLLLGGGESRDLGLGAGPWDAGSGGPARWGSWAGCGGPESAGPESRGPFNGLTGRLLQAQAKFGPGRVWGLRDPLCSAPSSR